jgi:hypothetical protein
MSKSTSQTTSTSASFPTSTQKSTPSRPRRLWVEYDMCGCTFNFKEKYFGIAHWWKFTKLRYWWRQYYMRVRFPHGKPQRDWNRSDSSCSKDSKNEFGDLWPILMTNEEYDHWFGDEE